MEFSRRLNRSFSDLSFSPCTLTFLLLIPLVVVSLLVPVFTFSGPNRRVLVSQKTLGFMSSLSFGAMFGDDGRVPNSIRGDGDDNRGINLLDNVRVSKNSLHHKLKIEKRTKHNIKVPLRKLTRSEMLEDALSKARSSIKVSPRNNNNATLLSTHGNKQSRDDYIPIGPMYRNANAFHRSYTEMERKFKVYVYEEGEAPIFHNGPCRSIYSTEGRFIHEMEKGNRFRTHDPEEAHVYFMPFSVVVMVQYLYEPDSFDMNPIGNTVADYVGFIAHKHPFWNRSQGADHFMLSCHDWGPHVSSYVPFLFNTSIRVLCNANTSEGFNPLKDVSLPEINLKTGELTGLLGGLPPSQRPILAFFAGGLHGHIRHLLINEWRGKDPDIQVYEKFPSNEPSYESMLKSSKYCLCPSGYEVASPRVVEAIYAECVPVLISSSYVPPFSDVLNWKKFAVIVKVEDIPNIKQILTRISEARYLKLQRRVKLVQRHFVVNEKPQRFDLFHMILHSIWLRRLNLRLHATT